MRTLETNNCARRAKAGRWGTLALLGVALGLTLAAPRCANAGMVGAYDISMWTLTNASADGFITATAGGIDITGGNTGSGEPGTTDFQILAAGTGFVSFTFVYFSLDDPSLDYAGYLIGPNFSPLADSNTSGTASFLVTKGQSFGFRVGTTDNQFEPGVLSISAFQAPVDASTAAPEPGTTAFVLAALALAAIFRLRPRLSGADRTNLRKVTGLPLAMVGIGLAGGLPLCAQLRFTGSPVTGNLVLVTQVNALQQAQLLKANGGLHAEPVGNSLEIKPNFPRQLLQPPASFSMAGAVTSTTTPVPLMQAMAVSPTTTAFHFDGIMHADQRHANNGNQFSVEPPSQGLAVANGYILEAVNNAIQIYSLTGVPQLPVALSTNQLFGLAPAIDRTTFINGPFPTDIRAFWDPDIRRWFVLQRIAANDGAGNPVATSRIYLAVSQTDNPTGTYNIYSMDTTNPLHAGCPCLPDFPQIGADQYGFYISSNEFNFYNQFVDASILAISKASLAAGIGSPTAFEFFVPYSRYEFTIHPATTPPGAAYFQQNGGVEYFVSSQPVSPDSAMAVFAMSNTSSLATAIPSLTLTETIVPTLAYSSPPSATQAQGPLPYGSTLGFSSPRPLDGADSRLLSVVYSGGRLYVTLGTQVVDSGNNLLAGGAYVVISLANRGGQITASALRQGYLMVNGNHLLRPAITVDAQGRGAIVFTLTGPGYYPSAAFVPFSAFSAGGTVQIAGRGGVPGDGFTGYDYPYVARWGDYSSAVIGDDGRIWLATEYIPSNAANQYPLSGFANWGTSIIAVNPQ